MTDDRMADSGERAEGRREIAWLRDRRGRLVRGLELVDRRLAELLPEEGQVRVRPGGDEVWEEFETADRQTNVLLEELQSTGARGIRARRQLRRAKRRAERRLHRALLSLEATR